MKELINKLKKDISKIKGKNFVPLMASLSRVDLHLDEKFKK
jgi:hypothetical protein